MTPVPGAALEVAPDRSDNSVDDRGVHPREARGRGARHRVEWIGPAQEYTRRWLAGQVRRVPRARANALPDAAWNALKESA